MEMESEMESQKRNVISTDDLIGTFLQPTFFFPPFVSHPFSLFLSFYLSPLPLHFLSALLSLPQSLCLCLSLLYVWSMTAVRVVPLSISSQLCGWRERKRERNNMFKRSNVEMIQATTGLA